MNNLTIWILVGVYLLPIAALLTLACWMMHIENHIGRRLKWPDMIHLWKLSRSKKWTP